jgi:hypothetical protein
METYIHKESGDEYIVVGDSLIKYNGEWVDGVDYIKPGVKKKFRRTKEEFNEKFTKVDDSEDRHLFKELKRRNISTLFVNQVLEQVGINISDKTLQNYLNSNMTQCKNPLIPVIIRKVIDNHDNTVKEIREKYEL